MDDFKEVKGHYRREVWESSEGFHSGMCHWSVSYHISTDLGWYTIQKSRFPMMPDKAFAESEKFLADAITNDAGAYLLEVEAESNEITEQFIDIEDYEDFSPF